MRPFGRGAALALLAGLGAFALAGSLASEATAEALFSSRSFLLLVAALALGLCSVLLDWSAGLRGRPASWGRFLLHAGVLAVVVGAVFNARFSRGGLIEVIEGQTLPLPEGRAGVRLDRFHAFYRPGRWYKGPAASLMLFEDGASRPALVHINRPASAAGLSLLLDKHGFAPFVSLRGPGGRLLSDYVSLETDLGEGPLYRRTLDVPGSGLRLALDLKPSPIGPLAKDPRLTVELSEKGRLLGKRVLRAGQPMKAGGYELSFGEVRYWAALHVRRDPGLPLVYAGFAITLAGAFLCYWRQSWA